MRRTWAWGQRYGWGERALFSRRFLFPCLFALLIFNACSWSNLRRDTTRVASTADGSCAHGSYWDSVARSCRSIIEEAAKQATDPSSTAEQRTDTQDTPAACAPGMYWDSVALSCRSISPAAEQGPPTLASPDRKTTQRVGTAFVVRPDGFLLTAFHVVQDAKTIEVFCPEAGNVNARVEQFSKANDLAVLRVAGKTPTYLSLVDHQSVGLGEQVFTIGYPAPDVLGNEAKFTDGVVSSLSVAGDAGYMQISVPVHPGNSGGPLLNNSGDVVGVVIATVPVFSFLKETGVLPQNVSWAVKGAFAAPLFNPPPRSRRITDRSAVIRRAVKATCFVTISTEADE